MGKNYYSLFIIALTLLVLGGCQQASKEKITLALNLEEGKVYTLTVDMDQDISQEPMGNKIDMKQKMKMGFSFAVKKVDTNGNAVIDVTFDSIYFSQDGPLGHIVYDSEDEYGEVPLPAKGFAALVGEGFTMELTPAGFIEDVQGVDLMLEHIMERIDLPFGGQLEQVKEQMKRSFGDEAMLSQMENMMSIFPEEPVGIGDTWSRRFVMSGMMPMAMNNKWKLKDRRNGRAIIEVKSDIEPNEAATALETAVGKMKYSLSGSQQGTLELDEATGWTIQAVLNQEMEGKIEMGRISWPIKAKSFITMVSPL
jgi:hypothetical protein